MTHAIIKQNIQRLLKERNWKIADLENKLGVTRSVSNILRGSSKNPTIELLQSIAQAFNIDVQDLIEQPMDKQDTDIELLLNSCQKVIEEINALSLSDRLSYKVIISIIKEAYEYSLRLDLKSVDQNFVKWAIYKHSDNKID